MKDQSKMLVQTTLPGMEIYTSLPESAVGLSQSESQESKKDRGFGQVVAHANHYPLQINTKETVQTCGRTSIDLSKTDDLRYALASRLSARLQGLGSPLYDYKWKVWDMLQSAPICALRASARRTFGNVCTGDQFFLDHVRLAGWATPTQRDWKDGALNLKTNKVKCLLGRQVLLCYALTVKGDRLNPEFTRWLMGFPKEWGN